MIARAVEEKGIPTMVLGSAFDLLSSAWPPRTSFVNYPLGHSAGKPFDEADQYRLVRASLEGFALHTKAGQVNVLGCDWGLTEDFCATVGGAEVVLRRDTDVKYQNQKDLDAAITRHGAEKAKGIVSPEATRQQVALDY